MASNNHPNPIHTNIITISSFIVWTGRRALLLVTKESNNHKNQKKNQRDFHVGMVWKMKLRRANKGSPASLGSSPGSHDSSISTTRCLPSKSCLHASDSMSSNSLAGMESASGSHSSVRSETEKILLCDQSSSHHSEATSQKGCLSYHDSLDNRLKGQSTTPVKLTAHSVASASSASSSSSKKVKFSVVEIRDYERQVGDNPSCTDGCPIR